MKTRFVTPLSLLILIATTSCQQLTKPDQSALEKMPVIEFGQTIPEKGEFILHFPAGQLIPVATSVKGTAFAQIDKHTLNVALKQDIYNYKNWVSFDRIYWQASEDVLDFHFNLRIPNYFQPQSGAMELEFNLK